MLNVTVFIDMMRGKGVKSYCIYKHDEGKGVKSYCIYKHDERKRC